MIQEKKDYQYREKSKRERIYMKCNNCGIELLGTMKKCPKCGFDTETGTVDSAYLENLNRSREKTPEPERYKKVISCEGRFSDDGGKGIR